MFYILDANNKVLASCSAEPDTKDLESRGEKIFFHNSDIPAGAAEFKNDGNGPRIEKKAPEPVSQKSLETSMIYDRMFKNAAKELATEGKITDPELVNYKDIAEKVPGNGKK